MSADWVFFSFLKASAFTPGNETHTSKVRKDKIRDRVWPQKRHSYRDAAATAWMSRCSPDCWKELKSFLLWSGRPHQFRLVWLEFRLFVLLYLKVLKGLMVLFNVTGKLVWRVAVIKGHQTEKVLQLSPKWTSLTAPGMYHWHRMKTQAISRSIPLTARFCSGFTTIH